jgi:hypothetical protein
MYNTAHTGATQPAQPVNDAPLQDQQSFSNNTASTAAKNKENKTDYEDPAILQRSNTTNPASPQCSY